MPALKVYTYECSTCGRRIKAEVPKKDHVVVCTGSGTEHTYCCSECKEPYDIENGCKAHGTTVNGILAGYEQQHRPAIMKVVKG